MPLSRTPQPVVTSAVASPSYSVVATDYAVPRAILAPHLAPPQLQSWQQQAQQQQRQQQQQHQQQHQLQPPPPPPPFHPQRRLPVNNPSVLHPVFFTNNFQRRQSYSQPAQAADTLHPAYMSSCMLPPAPPAPPLPHASSPVAHGYIYREAVPAVHRRGPNSKL